MTASLIVQPLAQAGGGKMLKSGGSDAALHAGTQPSRILWALLVPAIAAVLVLPAAYNRFALVFPDTSAYLSVAYASSWPIDRAGFYGLILAPALLSSTASTGVWLAILVQALIVSLVVLAAARRLLPHASPFLALTVVTGIALTTSLPWHASQLLPDAFTGALILLVWLAASREVGARGTPFLWLAVCVLGLVHFTHVALIAAGAAAALLTYAFAGTRPKELAARGLAALLTIAAILTAHTAIYGTYFGRWSPSPLGGYFLFARMNEDGLVPRWFDRHCGVDASRELCDLRPAIPHDSQQLLWGKGPSPLYERINKKHGTPESWVWVDRVNQAAIGALKEQPLAFAASAAGATVNQFAHFQVLDDECPENCVNLKMFEWRPSLIEPVRSSRQLTNGLPRQEIRLVTGATATLGLLLLLPVLAFAIRRRDVEATALLATVALCLVTNAAMAGALSDVHDRYQSRIVWLAPFAVLMVIARWRISSARPDEREG